MRINIKQQLIIIALVIGIFTSLLIDYLLLTASPIKEDPKDAQGNGQQICFSVKDIAIDNAEINTTETKEV